MGILAIEAPTQCVTSEPVTLALTDDETDKEVLEKANFSGTTTIPPMTCEGLAGLVEGPALTALMSGPENPFVLGIKKPK